VRTLFRLVLLLAINFFILMNFSSEFVSILGKVDVQLVVELNSCQFNP